MRKGIYFALFAVMTLAGSSDGAVFEVINTDDTGAGSLRAAVQAANAVAGPHTIVFDIPGPGPHVINSGSSLTVTGDNITIDGSTQPGYSGTPLVQLSGSVAAGGSSGLIINGDSVEVRGLSITSFPFRGISLSGSGGLVEDCYLGVTPGGTAAGNTSGIYFTNTSTISGNLISGNSGVGIQAATADAANSVIDGNWIGLNAAGDGAMPNGSGGINVLSPDVTITNNVISGNTGRGLLIDTVTATNTIIQGNRIGTNPAGTAAIANTGQGITIQQNASGTVIGGVNPGEGNLISGNTSNGILILANGSGVTIQGNTIGLSLAGDSEIPNGANGINVASTAGDGHLIGGNTEEARNVISGNTQNGIRLDSLATGGSTIERNWIGLNATGDGILANAGDGVQVRAPAVTIRENVISGNTLHGVHLLDATSEGTVLHGNRIGTNPAGTAAFANSNRGVAIGGNATGIIVGGVNPGEGNLISGNNVDGILIATGATSSTIQGNYIGINIDGDAAIPNGNVGIVTAFSSGGGHLIGGNQPGARNIISGNSNDGIRFDSDTAAGNTVEGNWIGLSADGDGAIGNGVDGIDVRSPDVSVLNNLISGNSQTGIYITSGNASNALVVGNKIGTDATGTVARPNGALGIFVNNQVPNAQIGTATPGEGNVISGNVNTAVYIVNSTATVQGNMLGVSVDGSSSLANGGSGISVEGATASALIGGESAGEGNVISGNASRGIILSAGASNTIIQGNIIGLNQAGDAALPNMGPGILLTANSGGNNLIGGSSSGARNLISGNGNDGIRFDGNTAADNTIEGNWIGLNQAGDAAIPNGNDGIDVRSPDVMIRNNVISGNAVHGVRITGLNATGTVLHGNKVGTNSAGTTAIANTGRGVAMEGNASGSVIGGVNPGEGNLLSGNAFDGILIAGGATGATVQGNIIGLNLDGDAAIPNGNVGIVTAFGSGGGHLIGGNTSGARNVISGNNNDGIRFDGDTAAGNFVEGNWIGLNLDGDSVIPNGNDGIEVQSPDVTVLNNTIAGHSQDGVRISGANATGAVITGNQIGTSADGTITLGNAGYGILFRNGANSNLAGGDTLADQNLIVGNRAGIFVTDDPGTTNNQIAGNSIRDNDGIAIGIGVAGPLSDSPLQAPSGEANDRQNAPYIHAVGEGDLTVGVSLHSAPDSTFRIDVYRNTACHPSGYGDASEWVGFAALSTDGAGNGTTSITLVSAATVGESFTATATSASGSTSGISQCMPVSTDPFPTIVAIERAGGAGEASSDPEVAFDVVYSRPVRGATAADFEAEEGGTLSGAIIDDVEFPLGNAAVLTSGDMLGTTTGTLDLAGASFTIEFWARRDAVSTPTIANDFPIAYGLSPAPGDYLTLGWAGGRAFRFGFNGDDLDTVVEWGLAGEWEHWAATFDAGSLERRVYRNGVLQAQDVAAAPLLSNGSLTIGSNALGDFTGAIDEVRVWNNARSQVDIEAAMYSPLEGTETGLLALFQFDDLTDPLLPITDGTPAVEAGGIYSDFATVHVIPGTGSGSLAIAHLPSDTVVDNRRVPILVTGSEPTEPYDYTEPSFVRDWLILND